MVAKNTGSFAAGVALLGSSAALQARRCTFDGNRGELGDSAGALNLYTAGGVASRLRECVIRNNQGGQGAAVYNTGSLELTSCNITDNNSSDQGGGVVNAGPYARLTMLDCLVENNQAVNEGGGLVNDRGANVANTTANVINCTLRRNQATNAAGIFNSGELTLDASIVTDNIAIATNFAASALYNTGSATLRGASRLAADPIATAASQHHTSCTTEEPLTISCRCHSAST